MISTWTTTRRRVSALVLVGFLLAVFGGASAIGASKPSGILAQQGIDTFWVSQQGNDANPGTTPDRPFRTIQRALSRVGPGDTVMVGAGTWPKLDVRNIAGLYGLPVTIRSAPGAENQVWFTHGDLGSEFGIFVQGSTFVILDDLNVHTAMWGVRIVRSKGIVYRNSEVHNTGQEAIGISERSAHVAIENNYVHHSGRIRPTWGEGIYLGTGNDAAVDTVSHVLLRGNEVAWTPAEAIDVKPWVTNVTIEHNRIHDIATANSGAIAVGIGRVNYPDANVLIRYNRIWNIARTSQWSDGNAIALSASATVHDNVMYNLQHRGIIVDANFVNTNARTVRIFNNTITNWGLRAIEVWNSPNPAIVEMGTNTLGGPVPPEGPLAPSPAPPPVAAPPAEAASIAQPLVAAGYRDFLGRQASEQELAYWTSGPGAGVGLPRFLLALATSDEWLGRMVDGFYTNTLGRPGEAEGRGFWIDRLRAASVPSVAAQFYGSPENVARVGDTGAWIDQLYRALLGRPADGADVEYWVAQLGARSHQSVALEIFQSPESRARRVADLYRALLGREPDPQGHAFWTDRILYSGDLSLAVSLATSPEYRSRNGG